MRGVKRQPRMTYDVLLKVVKITEPLLNHFTFFGDFTSINLKFKFSILS